jgi:glutaminase
VSSVDYRQVVEQIARDVRPLLGRGAVADFVPALAAADPKQFGMALSTLAGEEISVGDAGVPFSIQSISKVLTLTLVLGKLGEELWQRVGREPSGNPFNSLVQLEYERGLPRNPFINAGALVVTDLLMRLHPADPLGVLLDFARTAARSTSVHIDGRVAQSEKARSHRNQALAALMKSFGNIDADLDQLLDVYCAQCAITMTCQELARTFLFLANRGVVPHTSQRVLTTSQAKRLSALMLTCGLYDESGDFAFRVGLPGKSGIGGGIAAIIPGLLSVAVWSPGLDGCGNSLAGIQALEQFTTATGISVF